MNRIELQQFTKKLESIIVEGENLLSTLKGETNGKETIEQNGEWVKSCSDFFLNQFDSKFNVFQDAFEFDRYGSHRLASNSRHSLALKKLGHEIKVLSEINKICVAGQRDSINAILSELYIDSPDTESVMDIILHFLYAMHDGSYHSMQLILMIAGISVTRDEEIVQMADVLKRRGRIDVAGDSKLSSQKIQISVKGKLHIEKLLKRKTNSGNTANRDKTVEEMHHAIDAMLKHMVNLGFGQEILYEEMQELKDLYGKTKKRTWQQLLKMKLFDLAVDKIVDKDTVAYVYRELTETQFVLPTSL